MLTLGSRRLEHMGFKCSLRFLLPSHSLQASVIPVCDVKSIICGFLPPFAPYVESSSTLLSDFVCVNASLKSSELRRPGSSMLRLIALLLP